jgi:hypothetical protein
VDGAVFREVTKEAFQEVYFRLGGGDRSGWTADYWLSSFADAPRPGWQFMVEDPASPAHDCMWIVTDNEAKEYRLFFMTDESTESVFDFPGKD